MENMRIRCPKCEWEPDGGAYWECDCGTAWNTFDTVGVCPGCGKKWHDTQCPGPFFPGGCGAWSPHDDWYIIPFDPGEMVERIHIGKTICEPYPAYTQGGDS
jgi:hypothetical protein